ncbi:MAG: hypothetical protein RL377_709, partial [Bacteroidota bacterium]
MKRVIFLACFICIVHLLSNAQSTKWIKNRIAPTLIENCENIKSNGKKVKNGECFV